jgi:hypothetical protein
MDIPQYAIASKTTLLEISINPIPFQSRTSRGMLSLLSRALVAARSLLGAVEIAAALRALLQKQTPPVKDDQIGALDFHEDWRFHVETHSIRLPGAR